MVRRLLILLAFAAASPAVAAPRTSSLSWVRLGGAEECIAAPELARAVETRLGRTVFAPPSSADLAVEGHVEPREGGGWRAVLRLTDGSGAALGDRTVESAAPTCGELGRAVAVTLALMIDPPGEPPPPPPPPEPPPPPPPPPAAAPRWQLGVDGSLTGGAGAVPGVGVGGLLAARVRPPGFVAFVAEGTLVPFSRMGTEAAHTDFTRLLGGAQVCPFTLDRGPVTLDACLGVDAGVIFVLDSTESLTATEKVLVDAEAALHVRWTVVGPMVLRAGLHPTVPLRAVTFTTTDGAAVYTPAPVAGYLDVGIGVAW